MTQQKQMRFYEIRFFELTGDDISRSLPILKPNSKSDIQIRNPESQDQSVLR